MVNPPALLRLHVAARVVDWCARGGAGGAEVRARVCACLALRSQVAAPAELMQYVVPKGYIAIDGTSLTVCEVREGSRGGCTVASRDSVSEVLAPCAHACMHAAPLLRPCGCGLGPQVNMAEGWFTVMLVAFTQSKIVVPLKPVGAKVGRGSSFRRFA